MEMARWLLSVAVVSIFWTGFLWSDFCHLKHAVADQESRIATVEKEVSGRFEALDRKLTEVGTKVDIILRRLQREVP